MIEMPRVTDAAQTVSHSAAAAVRAVRGVPADTYHPSDTRPQLEMQDNARHSDDDLPRIAFESRLKPLTAKQEAAINFLSLGKTVVATARALKVNPSTVHRWKSHHPLFIAELNRRQASLFDAMTTKLRLTMDKAVSELLTLMTGPNRRERIETMWKLLPMLRPQKLIAAPTAVEATDVVDEQIRAARAERGEIADAEITLEDRLAQVAAEDLVESAPIYSMADVRPQTPPDTFGTSPSV